MAHLPLFSLLLLSACAPRFGLEMGPGFNASARSNNGGNRVQVKEVDSALLAAAFWEWPTAWGAYGFDAAGLWLDDPLFGWMGRREVLGSSFRLRQGVTLANGTGVEVRAAVGGAYGRQSPGIGYLAATTRLGAGVSFPAGDQVFVIACERFDLLAWPAESSVTEYEVVGRFPVGHAATFLLFGWRTH